MCLIVYLFVNLINFNILKFFKTYYLGFILFFVYSYHYQNQV